MKLILLFTIFLGVLHMGEAFVVDIIDASTHKQLEIEEVDPFKTSIGQLKQAIQVKTGLQVADQRLVYRRKLLRDDRKLISDLVYYSPSAIQIFLAKQLSDESVIIISSRDNKLASKYVMRNETLGSLRKSAELGEGRIFFDGLELTGDDKTLNELQVYETAHLFVLNKGDTIKVKVNFGSDKVELFELEVDASVEELLNRIKSKSSDSGSIQKLVAGDTELSLSGAKVIEYCSNPISGLKVDVLFGKQEQK